METAETSERRGSAPEHGVAGAWPLLRRVGANVGRDNVSLIAAGLALFALLAIFPAFFAIVSMAGLLLSPESVVDQTQSLAVALPMEAAETIRGALRSIAESQDEALSVGAVVGIILALWSARKGMEALMRALNIVYRERETRGFVRRVLASLGLTLGAVLGFILLLLLAVAAPVVWSVLGVDGGFEIALAAVQWLVVWAMVVLALGVVYRFAPSRQEADWHWITLGSAVAATLWLLGTLAFSWYVGRFGTYGETYGALAGVVVLLLWLYLSGYTVLLGSEIDATRRRESVEHASPAEPA